MAKTALAYAKKASQIGKKVPARCAGGAHTAGRHPESYTRIPAIARARARSTTSTRLLGCWRQVVIAVKSSGDGDPMTNRALASVMREANALDVSRDVIDRNIKKALDPVTADYKERLGATRLHGAT